MEAHLYLGQACAYSEVRVGEIEVISINDTRAEVKADFSISVQLKSGNTYSESAPATLVWAKSDLGDWKLIGVTLKSP